MHDPLDGKDAGDAENWRQLLTLFNFYSNDRDWNINTKISNT